jgi:hypothetical protein
MRLRPLSSVPIAKDFFRTYMQTMDSTILMHKAEPLRILSLRASQLPFCPRDFFINHALHGLNRPQDLRSAFYTEVGTVVHDVMQRYLSTSGRFLADYECRECGTWHRQSFKNECCGFPCRYHEVRIDIKGMKGHIDAIYRDEQGKLWILDFKTTSIKAAPKKKTDPGSAYIEQIEVYAVLFEIQYGMKIEGFMDAFIVRDNPANEPPVYARLLDDTKREEVLRRIKRYRRAHRDALDAESWTEVKALLDYDKCTNAMCDVCGRNDEVIFNKLKQAYKIGKNLGHIPLRAFVNKEMNDAAK